MSTPLISVIVPVYNVEKYLCKCIESIQNQTYKNLEIILVNDGSTDSSYQICEKYAALDSRITLIKKENGGLASARNKGLEYAHGDFVGFVDSDDWIELDTYETMYRATAASPKKIIVCGRYNVDELTGAKEPLFGLPNVSVWSRQETIRRFLTWDSIDTSVCDKLFPAKLIMGLTFPSGLVSEDILFTYPALERSNGVVHIGECKYNYLQRSGSITHSTFSPKSKGLLTYPKKVWECVYENFTELRPEADYYRFSRAIIYINRLYSSGGKEREEAREIRKRIWAILRNKCFSWREKVLALSMAFHFFWIIERLNRMRRKGKKC